LFTSGRLNRQMLITVGCHRAFESSFIWRLVIRRCTTNSQTRGGAFVGFPISEESPKTGNCHSFETFQHFHRFSKIFLLCYQTQTLKNVVQSTRVQDFEISYSLYSRLSQSFPKFRILKGVSFSSWYFCRPRFEETL